MRQASTLSALQHLLERPHPLLPPWPGQWHQREPGAVRAAAAWAWAGPDPELPSVAPGPMAPCVRPALAAPPLPLTRALSAVAPVPPRHAWQAPRALPPAPSSVVPAPPAGERREVRMAPEVLAAMTTAAAATGRHESEIWAEAAREWLARHTPDDDPPPPPGAIQRAPVVRASRDRCWGAIDVLLGDLRHPRPACDPPFSASGDIDPAA